MNAVIALLGGVRATVFLGLAVLLGVLLAISRMQNSAIHREFDGYKAKVQAATAIAAQKAAESAKKAAEARQEYYATLERANASYEAGRQSAITYQNTVVADLRAGNKRLRGEWAACLQRAPQLGTPGTPAGVGSEGASVSAEAFGRVLRVGSDADNETKWYQQALKATRHLYEQCAKE